MAHRTPSVKCNIVWHCVSGRPPDAIHRRVKSLSRATVQYVHALFLLLSYMQHKTVRRPRQTTLLPLQNKWHSSPCLAFFSTRFWGALWKGRGGGRTKSLPPFSPVWNKAAFWGGVLSCITHQEEQGNKQGQIHQTEGDALQDGERWVLIKVEQIMQAQLILCTQFCIFPARFKCAVPPSHSGLFVFKSCRLWCGL